MGRGKGRQDQGRGREGEEGEKIRERKEDNGGWRTKDTLKWREDKMDGRREKRWDEGER